VSAPSGPTGGGARPSTVGQRVAPGRLIAALVLLALGAAAVGGTLFVRAVNRTHLDPGVLAVAPLAVGVPGLDTAGPAIARGLVAALRAGEDVHPVPLDSVIRAWDASLAPAAAAVLLAQRSGAGLVVLAQLWPTGGGRDSVLLAARLLDVSNNLVRALYEIRSPRERAATLGDSLAALLRRDLRGRPAPATGGPGTPPSRAR
jgi:hypothetical protein